MELTIQHFAGMIITLALVFGPGIIAARRVRTSTDFSVSSRRAGTALVAGTILGTMIGGSSTVGTAQLAFMYGLSAWWFTLGNGLACLLLAIFFTRPLLKTRFETIPQLLTAGYGSRAGLAAALFSSVGLFINVVPQVFSAVALIAPVLPLNESAAALITVSLMTLYVVCGGIRGAGLMGGIKTLLAGTCLLLGGGMAFYLIGGVPGLKENFSSFPWFSMFGRGINDDLAAAFTMLVGVLSSQIYFQAIFSSRSLQVARLGLIISAAIAPVVGAGGIMIGLYMRASNPDIIPAQALPLFIMKHFTPVLSGLFLALLVIVCVASGAGVTLGISTVLSRDIYQRLYPSAPDRRVLLVFRLLIILVMLLALATVYIAGSNVLILEWGYLSLGLRGASICFPLLSVLFLKGRVHPYAGRLAIILGPATVILFSFLPTALNPVYPGLAVSFLAIAVGLIINHKTGSHQEPSTASDRSAP